ncbi:AbrB/MazE/SpoVT family DNA-binding domain-containing protein [bacterium]|nr:AbrB/MazE/SpoVT family DNA-binding domain-containing protein [bacterium]
MEIRRKSSLREGDFVSFEERNGEIVMSPVRVIKKDQAYFWTKEWQKKEQEAEDDLKKGRYKKFDSADGLIKDLHSK